MGRLSLWGNLIQMPIERVMSRGSKTLDYEHRCEVIRAKVKASYEQYTVAELFKQIVQAKNPLLEVGKSEHMDAKLSGTGVVIPVNHLMNEALPKPQRDAILAKYGPVVQPLLDCYAVHNGGCLFAHRQYEGQDEPTVGFVMASYYEWDELMQEVMSWVTGVTWQDNPEEIPDYLRNAIPFGFVPGDYEKWLFITQGKHAGKVMQSDDAVHCDEQRFENLAQFLSTLLEDTPRIVGASCYVCYKIGRFRHGYPLRYLPDGA